MRSRTFEDFRTQERLVWDHMRAHRGDFVTTEDLIRVLYPDPDDEPKSARHGVFTVMHALRTRHGLPIITKRVWTAPPIRLDLTAVDAAIAAYSSRAPDAHPAGEAA